MLTRLRPSTHLPIRDRACSTLSRDSVEEESRTLRRPTTEMSVPQFTSPLRPRKERYAEPLPTPSSQVALYSTFAVFGFFGGSIMNRIGARLTLSIGALGYSLCEPFARFRRGAR